MDFSLGIIAIPRSDGGTPDLHAEDRWPQKKKPAQKTADYL